MPEIHARYFGASSSHAWLNCSLYPHMQLRFEDPGSEYAAKGTLAHSIAEYKARAYFLEPTGKRAYNTRMKQFAQDPVYDKEMDGATDLYLDTLKDIAMDLPGVPFIALETRVDYSEYAPEGFGTADCIMISDDRIVIVDYKNGSGVPVDAERNSQMMLYALGALQVFRPIYGDTIKKALLVIVQPHAGGVKRWATTVADLRSWAREVVTPAAQMVLGSGDHPAVPGDWCRFCRGKAQCRARAEKMLAACNQIQRDPMLLEPDEIGEILRQGEGMVSWFKDVQDYALKSCLDGAQIPGYKVVEGRGSRAWVDLDSAFQTLQERGVPEAMLYERKPVTAPALEKALGAKEFADKADGLVIKQPGKPTLVPESDKRRPYDPAAAAFKEVQV